MSAPSADRPRLRTSHVDLGCRDVAAAIVASDQRLLGWEVEERHLEVEVDDLAGASAHAGACGAPGAALQPQDDVRVHLDPADHPCCLCTG